MPRLSQKITDAFNDQINMELASGYTYLAMSAHCAEENLQGAASWLRIQWEEELAHAIKLMDYMADRGSSVLLKAIAKPPTKFKSLLDVFEQVLKHEQDVTAAIYRIMDLATSEKDYAAQALLQWYVNEQVEERITSGIPACRLAGDSGSGSDR
jgi:ferritin